MKRPSVLLVTVTTMTVMGSLALATPASAVPATPSPPPSSGQGATEALSAVGIKVRPDGWIEYNSMLRRVGAKGKTSRVAGVRDKDHGCTLPGSGQASRSSQTTYTEEVAYNPATCEFDVVVADVTATQLANLRSLSGATSSSVPSRKDVHHASPQSGSQDSPALDDYYFRHLKTSWIDPFDIVITSQLAQLEWGQTTWYYADAERDSFQGCIGDTCLDQTYVVDEGEIYPVFFEANGPWTVAARVHFQNLSFALWVVGILGAPGWAACGFPTSSEADFYHVDSVTGSPDGSASWSWDDSKDGACTNLVHHADETGPSLLL